MEHVEFFNFANKLVDSKEELESVDVRVAVGRVYYYIYHEILKWVESEEKLSQMYNSSDIFSSHKRLINVFYKLAIETKQLIYGKICRLLGVLHTTRCTADYLLDQKLGKEEFIALIANFEDLKDACRQVKAGLFAVNSKELENETINVTETQNAKISVCKKPEKKPSIRILE